MGAFRSFLILWLAEAFSNLGTQLTGFALGVWALQATGSVTWLSVFAVAATAPRLFLAPVAGSLVDRLDRRHVLLFGHFSSGCCTLALALLFFTASPSPAIVAVLVALSSLLGAAQYPAFQASTTLLVAKDQLPRANGLVHLGLSAALIVAPMSAGLLLGRIGVAGILLIDVLTFSVALSALAFLKIPAPPKEQSALEAKSALRDFLFGFSFIRQRPSLLAFVGLFAALSFCLGLAQILFTPLILAFADEVVLGQVLAQAGIGMLLGSLLMVVLGGSGRLMRTIFWLCLAQGILLTITAVGQTAAWIGMGLFLTFSLRPCLSACSATVWQRKVPAVFQGRVFATRSAIVQGALPLAYLVAGPLCDHVFEPLMAGRQGITSTFAPAIFGGGAGSGIALLIALLGIGISLLGGFTRLFPLLWLLEEKSPDHVS